MAADTQVPPADRIDVPVLNLLDGPCLTVAGQRHDIPEGAKRLLVFVALHRGRAERRRTAGVLWPDCMENRAAGNLRSALWRLKGAGIDVVQADKFGLTLRRDVVTDVQLVSDWAARLIRGSDEPADLDLMPCWFDALSLLPGWYDDWVLLERERLRQRMLHALEALSRALARVGRYAEAVEAAVTVVGAEPLRESAQRVLIEAHLCEGNRAEARRAFEAYRVLLRREVGVEPSPGLFTLAGDVGVTSR